MPKGENKGFPEEKYETMNPKIVIRNETHDDVSAITEVTIAAFKTLEISNHTEQFVIDALRAAKAVAVWRNSTGACNILANRYN